MSRIAKSNSLSLLLLSVVSSHLDHTFSGLLSPFPVNISLKSKEFWSLNFHQEVPIRSKLGVLLILKENWPLGSQAVLRPKLFSQMLRYELPNSCWQKPSNICLYPTVCKAKDVILFIFKFPSSPLVSLVFANLEICPPAQLLQKLWSFATESCGQEYGSPISISPLSWEVWNLLLPLRTRELSSECKWKWQLVSRYWKLLDIGNLPGFLSKGDLEQSQHILNPHQSSVEMKHEWEANLCFFNPLRFFPIASCHSVN